MGSAERPGRCRWSQIGSGARQPGPPTTGRSRCLRDWAIMETEEPIAASVVVATYNRPDYVRTCLEHLRRQTLRPVETVVVDASPGPATRDVVAQFDEVVYLRNERGRGSTATSRAIGMTACTGDVVAFIDDDAFADPTWLAELVARYDAPDVGAVGGLARNRRPGEESEGLDEIGLLLPDGRLTGNFAANPGHDVDVDHLLGANMSVRRSLVERLGGIHDHYPGTCLREETDIVLRMGRAGYRIVFTPDAAVDHIPGPYAKGQRFDLRYAYYGERNHLVLLARTLGMRDSHFRRYYGTAARTIGAELRRGATALAGRPDPAPRRRLRGLASGVARAAAGLGGVAVGSAVVFRLRLTEGPVR